MTWVLRSRRGKNLPVSRAELVHLLDVEKELGEYPTYTEPDYDRHDITDSHDHCDRCGLEAHRWEYCCQECFEIIPSCWDSPSDDDYLADHTCSPKPRPKCETCEMLEGRREWILMRL